MIRSSRHSQSGAALLVALIMLLVIGLLAVGSTREAALEGRITGNFLAQHKRLNYAEASLREGEIAMTAVLKPLEPMGACTDDDDYCFYTTAAQYGHDFGACDADAAAGLESKLLTADSYTAASQPAPELFWYAVEVNSGASEGQAENPEYGNMMRGIGTFRYEINSRARDEQRTVCSVVRSTTAKAFN